MWGLQGPYVLHPSPLLPLSSVITCSLPVGLCSGYQGCSRTWQTKLAPILTGHWVTYVTAQKQTKNPGHSRYCSGASEALVTWEISVLHVQLWPPEGGSFS